MFFRIRSGAKPGDPSGSRAIRTRTDKRRIGSRRPVLVAVMMATAAMVPLLSAVPASAGELIPKVTHESHMVDVAFDSSGNLYESEYTGNVNVWPVSNGSIFGKAVTAGRANTLVTLNNVPGIAFDSNGDLFMTNDDGSSGGSISVLPASSGSIFGQDVTANTLTTLVVGLDNPLGLAFDSSGNLYYATQNGIWVLPVASGDLFGQPVTADTPTELVSGLTEGGFVALDSSGDLFYTDIADEQGDAASVNVLPESSGTIFGTEVSADTPATLVSGLTTASGLAFDNSGNLYVDYYGVVGVLSNTSETIDGTSVTADTLTPVAVGLLGDLGSTSYQGDIYVADQLMGSVDQLTTPTASITGVTFGGSAANPVIFVTGTGFNTSPPAYPYQCGNFTGVDYKYGDLYLTWNDDSFGAGLAGDCIDLTLAKITSTKAVFGLGNDYSAGDYNLGAGDPFTVGVDATTFSGTVSYTSASDAKVTKVSPVSGPGGGGTTVTIKGKNLDGTKYVFFGSNPATQFTVKSDTEIVATAPSGSGTDYVTVVNSSDEVSPTGVHNEFEFLAPEITKIDPTKGPDTGGTSVIIKGTDFEGASKLTYPSGVMFGGTAAKSFTVVSGTEIKAVTPAEGAGTVDVTVTAPGGTSNGVHYKFTS